MTVKLCCLVVLALIVVVSAQETAPDGFQLWTGASLKQMAQELRTEAAGDPHHIATHKLADFQNDLFMLAHREADGVAEWHETQADVFFVQSGSATLLVGGNMVGGETTELHEKRNGRIEGGVRHKLSPGDVIRIPPKTPHQILLDGSKEFTYFVIKVKGY
jgi:mannose-6-phosphate isomerase-like protein (cupin superfamily)